MKLAIASDHAGVELKTALKSTLETQGHEVLDLGTNSDASVDYPDFADALAGAIKEGKAAMGVLICGSGIGISIAANRYKHIRAALCHSAEAAILSRQHNNANVLVLGARFISEEAAKEIAEAFFSSEFEGGRHERRVAKLS